MMHIEQKVNFRNFLRLLTLVSASTSVSNTFSADTYPSRAVTIVVPFAAGGTTDILARQVAQSLGEVLRQTVIVDNRAGAGGTIGATFVMRAPADGYTLLMGGPSDQVNSPFLMSRPPYDPARDFEPVGCIVRAPNVLVVNAKLPIKSVADLVRIAKAEPNKLNYASAGPGNTSHLLGELLAQQAGISLTHVPYKGNGPAITDTIGGQVQMLFASPISIPQQIKNGTLRPIATTASKRIITLPDVPTFREVGIDIENYSWSCLVVPAKTPNETVEKLHGALVKAMDNPGVLKAIEASGGEKFLTTRDEARRFIASERKIWAQLIRARNIKTE